MSAGGEVYESVYQDSEIVLHAPGPSVLSTGPIPSLYGTKRSTTRKVRPAVAPEVKKLTDKPTQSNAARPDKERDRHPSKRAQSYVPRKPLQITVGREVQLAQRGNPWRGFQEQMDAQNQHIGRAIAPASLIMKYVTDEEMASMLKGFLDQDKAGRKKNRSDVDRIRDHVEKMSVFIDEQQAKDAARERRLLQASPDLAKIAMERMLDPDNPKWYEGSQMTDISALDRSQISAWMPASFQVARVAGKDSMISMSLDDTSGVLFRARDQFVDALGDKFDFDTTEVSERWMPSIDIFKVGNGQEVDFSDLQITRNMPYLVPLCAPGVHTLSHQEDI